MLNLYIFKQPARTWFIFADLGGLYFSIKFFFQKDVSSAILDENQKNNTVWNLTSGLPAIGTLPTEGLPLTSAGSSESMIGLSGLLILMFHIFICLIFIPLWKSNDMGNNGNVAIDSDTSIIIKSETNFQIEETKLQNDGKNSISNVTYLPSSPPFLLLKRNNSSRHGKENN